MPDARCFKGMLFEGLQVLKTIKTTSPGSSRKADVMKPPEDLRPLLTRDEGAREENTPGAAA